MPQFTEGSLEVVLNTYWLDTNSITWPKQST